MNADHITRKSGSNFLLAFWGLPKEQRRALGALYAYCRTVDDMVDEAKSPEAAKEALNRWRGILSRIRHPSTFDPSIAHELSEAAKNFPIEEKDLDWILSGVEMDLYRTRYDTFEQLLSYCDGVASAVGLCTLAIFGGERKHCEAYALATGRALQLTNILRDVGVDAQRGRIYLPREDLEQFGYRERDLMRKTYNDGFRALMGFETNRTKTFYEASLAALPEEERRRFPAAELMREIYRSLLTRIERKEFRVFDRKVRVPRSRKFWIALRIWAPVLVRPGQA